MNLKALGLASAAILFSSSPMLTQARKQPIGEPKSRQQSKLAVAPIPLEIKSDRIGETIAQFTAHHPNAKCKEESVDIRTCSQRAGVSLAGLTTMGTSCDPPTSRYFDGVCGTEGLIARFSKDKLKDLTYRFYVNEAINYPQSNILEICRAFTTKYGRPDDGDGIHTCDWDMKNKDDEIEQFLSATTQHFKIAGKDAAFTTIFLFDVSPSKDSLGMPRWQLGASCLSL